MHRDNWSRGRSARRSCRQRRGLCRRGGDRRWTADRRRSGNRGLLYRNSGTHRWRRRSFLLLRNRSQHVPGTGNVGEVNLGLDFFFTARRSRTGLPRLGRSFRRGADVHPYLLRFVLFQRTGVRLFLRHSDQRKRVEYGFTLHFQLSGKIVDSNLTHPAFRFSVL